jgi:hypothetical protein
MCMLLFEIKLEIVLLFIYIQSLSWILGELIHCEINFLCYDGELNFLKLRAP